MLDTGIVDENVEAAEALQGEAHHPGDLARFGHVGSRIDRLAARLTSKGFKGVVDLLGLAETIDDHGGSGRGEGASDAKANAAGRAGHDGDLAVQNSLGTSRWV